MGKGFNSGQFFARARAPGEMDYSGRSLDVTKPDAELEEWERCGNLNALPFADVAARFEAAFADSHSLRATLSGKPGERVDVTALEPGTVWRVATATVTIGPSGVGQLCLPEAACALVV